MAAKKKAAAKSSSSSSGKAPTKSELDAMPPGVALALADRYGVKGYTRPEATVVEAPASSDD